MENIVMGGEVNAKENYMSFQKAHEALVNGTFEGYGRTWKIINENGYTLIPSEIKEIMATIPAGTAERKARLFEMHYTVGTGKIKRSQNDDAIHLFGKGF